MIQSVDEVTRARYRQESGKILDSMSNAYFYNKYYLIGENIDIDKMYFYTQLNKLMCTDDCEVINYIEKKIIGELENCGIKKIKNKKLCDLAKECSKTKTCSVDKCLGEINF